MTGSQESSAFVDYRTFVPAMARYFARMEAIQGPAWSAGREAATLWERLLPGHTDTELAELDELMRAGTGVTSSAWYEMILFYPAWRGTPTETSQST